MVESTQGGGLPFPVERSTGPLGRARPQLEDFLSVVSSTTHGMWRFKWPALVVAWAICAVGWPAVYALPDVFQASTRIYINAESMIKRVIGDLTVPNMT